MSSPVHRSLPGDRGESGGRLLPDSARLHLPAVVGSGDRPSRLHLPLHVSIHRYGLLGCDADVHVGRRKHNSWDPNIQPLSSSLCPCNRLRDANFGMCIPAPMRNRICVACDEMADPIATPNDRQRTHHRLVPTSHQPPHQPTRLPLHLSLQVATHRLVDH